MNIENIKVADITPYENNPRENNITAEILQDSIRKYDFTNPILLDSHNIIISGHARFKAAIAMGMEEVPCIHIDDLPPEKIRALRIMVNRAGEYSEWDFRKLDEEMRRINELDSVETGELANLFGFDIGDPVNMEELTKERAETKEEKKEENDDDDNVVTCPYCGYSFDPDNPSTEDEQQTGEVE